MNFLDKIDKYFYEKESKKEFFYTLGAIVLALGFIIYYYIFPPLQNNYNKILKKYKNAINLKQNKMIFLALKAQNIRLNKDLKMLKEKLQKVRKEKEFFNELVNAMDFVKFNEVKWAEFVKNVIIDAQNEGLGVKLVENKIYNENEKNDKKENKKEPDWITKKMSIGLNLDGSYLNFINFIYKYENRKDLIRVDKIEIKNKNNFYVEFVLYGYER